MSSKPPPKKLKTEQKDKISPEEKLKEDYARLEEVQEMLEKINEEEADEIISIEKQYNTKKTPFFQKRNDIIKRIPGFWKQTFLNSAILCDCLTENDQKVFDHVTELNVEDCDNDNKGSYRITFKFNNNPWFKNDILSKEFCWTEEGQFKVRATPIEWKTGEDPFKGSSEESFFSVWFKGEEEEDEPDEIAQIIKEEIWPDPSKYYHAVTDFPGEGGEVDGEEGSDE